jgi:membrane associated rhomboid family serine protease
VAHLATNIGIGIVFLGLAMGCFGAGPALLLSFLGGALGNLATFFLHDGVYRSLGASGMVMAALGLLTAHSLVTARHERTALLVGRGVLAACLLVVLLGFGPKSDVVAHVGGFVAGTALGTLALKCRKRFTSHKANVLMLSLCTWLLITVWWLALR